MEEKRIDFSKGDEDKLTFVKKGVRNLEIIRFDLFFVIKEEIKVDRPGTPPEGLPAPHAGLNGFERPEKFASR